MAIKIPAGMVVELLAQAHEYANKSKEHTHEYGGFKGGDERAKHARIKSGRFGQLWVAYYCTINGIQCDHDDSPHTDSDSFDVKVNGWSIDVKLAASCLVGQIFSIFDSPHNTVDWYAVLASDRALSFIQPMGFIHKGDVIGNSRKFMKGDMLPGSNIKQLADYSYFVDTSKLKPFSKILSELNEVPRRVEYAPF